MKETLQPFLEVELVRFYRPLGETSATINWFYWLTRVHVQKTQCLEFLF